MKKARVITICGSLRFMDEIKIHAEKLELEGNCVLNIIYPTKEKDAYTLKERELLDVFHK